MATKLQKLVGKINNLTAKFRDETEAESNGNKAAGGRARKLSGEIGKACKEYRAASVAAGKD